MVRFNLVYFVIGVLANGLLASQDGSIDSKPLRDAITVDSIRTHQRSLQEIATNNNNNRMAVTQGYRSSVSYVQDRLNIAGYSVTRQPFMVSVSEDKNPPQLIQRTPTEQLFVAGADFVSMSSDGITQIEAEVEAVDLQVPSQYKNHSTSGCEPEDFSQFKAGNIALIQRGSCGFHMKLENALKAGAMAVIIFNEGNPEREGVFEGRIAQAPANYPVIGTSFAVGDALRGGKLAGPTGNTVFVAVDVQRKSYSVENVIAETKEGDGSKTVVLGAHLDSVAQGPGMNDNGSGSATILEIALKYASLSLVPKNKLRFIWFGAEEFGLLGSEFYVNSLNDAQKKNIMAMLNFDMLASSNYARFVYDGDSSTGSEGSGFIEQVFLDYFASINMPTHPTSFDGRSDYGPFIEVGIPAGGLFSGAEGRKSRELAQVYGGQSGKAFDPCYHRSCDDFAHTGDQDGSLALKSLDELSDAAAHAALYLANTDVPGTKKERTKPKVDFEYRGHFLIK